MIAFLLRRLASALPTLLGITLVTFVILDLLPTDPIRAWSEEGRPLSAEALERLRADLHTEQGPASRYLAWGRDLLRGDLGRSLRDGRPVRSVLAQALPWTVLLNLCAVLAIYGLAIPFGLLGASAPGSLADRLGGTLLLALYALPSFAAALLMQQLFAVRLGLLPLQGVGAAGPPSPPGAVDLLRHLVLPTLCLALSGWAFVARYARAAFRTTLGGKFLAVVRSKGLSPARAALHVVANTAVSLVSLLAAVLPGLAGGSVIIEQVFSWPGVGRLYLSSIEGRDQPVILGLTLLSGVAILGGQIAVDFLYLLVDPKIRERSLGRPADA